MFDQKTKTRILEKLEPFLTAAEMPRPLNVLIHTPETKRSKKHIAICTQFSISAEAGTAEDAVWKVLADLVNRLAFCRREHITWMTHAPKVYVDAFYNGVPRQFEGLNEQLQSLELRASQRALKRDRAESVAHIEVREGHVSEDQVVIA